ncbi:MAG: hypothetical protein U0Q07_03170 [Acidimicrobiales bacterium]
MTGAVPGEPTRELRYLAGVLDDFDAHHDRRPLRLSAGGTADDLAKGRAYEEVRERIIRPALEAVSWRIERRGHHAWIEDIPGPAALTALDEAHYDLPDISGLEFKVLPVADLRSATEAPFLRFSYDLGPNEVDASIGAVDPERPTTLHFDAMPLGSVQGAAVARLAIVLVEEVFLRRHRVLDAHDVDEADWAPDVGGIVPRMGESQDWVAASEAAPPPENEPAGPPKPLAAGHGRRPAIDPNPASRRRLKPFGEDRQLPPAPDDADRRTS